MTYTDVMADWQGQLDPREQQELRFAQIYALNYRHGTPGHLTYTTLAKVAQICNDLHLQVIHSNLSSTPEERHKAALEKAQEYIDVINAERAFYGLSGTDSKPEEMLKTLGLGAILANLATAKVRAEIRDIQKADL